MVVVGPPNTISWLAVRRAVLPDPGGLSTAISRGSLLPASVEFVSWLGDDDNSRGTQWQRHWPSSTEPQSVSVLRCLPTRDYLGQNLWASRADSWRRGCPVRSQPDPWPGGLIRKVSVGTRRRTG